jgi:multiple sugar transport system substrate-binding protein
MTLNRARPTRRDVLRLVGVGAAAGLLPACSSGTDARTVSWQAIPSYSLQGTDPKRVGYLRQQREAYESESGYRLDPQVTVSDTSAAMAKLLLQASQGRAPDVSQVDGYVFGRMSRYAQPLTRQLAAAGLRLDDWFPSLRTVMTGGGTTVHGLQFTTDVRVLYYRRDLVSRPPATWDELLSVAKPLAARGLYVTFPAGRSEGAVTTTLWPQFWAQGAELFDESGAPAFGSGKGYEAMRNALRIVQQLIGNGVSPDRVATFGAEDNQNADVVAGRVAMFVGGNWQAAALNNLLPGKDFFARFGVAPIPTISGERHVTSAGGWVWGGFTEDDRKLQAGIDWVMRAFVSDAGMASWCSLGGYLPPRQSVYDNPQYQKNPFTPTFREHLASYARGRPGARKYLEVSNSMQIALSSVAAGNVAPDRALDDALNRLT